MAFDDIDFSSGSRVVWPKSVAGTPVPPFRGVFCLYDVTDSSSVANVPPVLCKICNACTDALR